ncbi:MAG: TerB family tellurite resistance protein [Alphaproteobacteria bacterium]|nr:TerB family tellurite resistance protein [Alphaproteobacteria bacterium]
MLSKLKDFFSADPKINHSSAREQRELHIAAAAMLIQAAMTDGHVDEVERTRIGVLIERHFGVPREEVHQILTESEAKAEAAVDIYSFLRIVNDHFDHAERIALIEMLWDVVYADGELHDHEANLIRRISGMLGLTDIESGTARKKVLAERQASVEDQDAIHPKGEAQSS